MSVSIKVPDSPTVAPTPVAPAPSAFLSSLEEILQETERRLNLPPKSPKVSSTYKEPMLIFQREQVI